MLEVLQAQIDAQIERLAAGEPVDWAHLDAFSELFIVQAGLHYAREAVQRVNSADEQILEGPTDAQ